MPATVLLSSPPGSPADDVRKLITSAGFDVADHALGSAPAVDFGSIAVAVIEVAERTELAASQTRRWRAELGDQIVPVVWIASPDRAAAGLDAGDTTGTLREFIQLVDQFRNRATEVERLSAHQEADPSRHAAQISRELKPAMARLRETGDTIQSHVAADLWPLPTYRDLLFLK